MKKLYRKGTVHPSPPLISDHLAFLPATILTLAAALSPEDREVLAYLISCSNSSVNLSSSSYGPRKSTGTAAAKKAATAAKGRSSSCGDHPARFNCDCFRCYTSYWVRWDESPNRQLIHEIIDAFEDGVVAESKGSSSKSTSSKKERRNKSRGNNNGSGELKRSELSLKNKKELAQAHNMVDQETGGGGGGGGEVDEQDSEKGSVRSFVSFLGERIWGVWT